MGLFAPTRVQVPFSGRHQCLASMGTAIVPYPAQHYNSLPTIEDTGSSLKPPDIEQLAATVGQVFAKHQFWSFFRLICYTITSHSIKTKFWSILDLWLSLGGRLVSSRRSMM